MNPSTNEPYGEVQTGPRSRFGRFGRFSPKDQALGEDEAVLTPCVIRVGYRRNGCGLGITHIPGFGRSMRQARDPDPISPAWRVDGIGMGMKNCIHEASVKRPG